MSVCLCTFAALWVYAPSVWFCGQAEARQLREDGESLSGRQGQMRNFYLNASGTTASSALRFSPATVCCKPSVAAVSSSGGPGLISWTLLRSDAWVLELPDCNRPLSFHWLECQFYGQFFFSQSLKGFDTRFLHFSTPSITCFTTRELIILVIFIFF